MYNLSVNNKGKRLYSRGVSNTSAIGIALGIFALVGLWVFGSAWLFEVLWNYVVPGVFNGPHIGYWMAFCVITLLNFFKSSLHISRKV